MKRLSPERNVRRYRKDGLPNGKPLDEKAYRKAWYRTEQKLARRMK